MLRLVNTAEQASACLPIGTFLLPLYVNLIGSSGGEGRDEAGCSATAGFGDGWWVGGSGTWIPPPGSTALLQIKAMANENNMRLLMAGRDGGFVMRGRGLPPICSRFTPSW